MRGNEVHETFMKPAALLIFNCFISFSEFENKKDFIYSHPKLRKLEEIVVEHFKSWKKGCAGES